jgi:SH3-like domain-containing protein
VGWVSAVDSDGRTVWITDAHRDGKRFIVRSDEKLTAFVELQRAIHEFAVSLIS